MTFRAALLACTALVVPTAAHADPITSFFALLFTSSMGTLTVAGIALSGSTGLLLLNVGFSLITGWLNRSNTPPIEAARVNSRLDNATRWQLAGTAAVGGELGTFAEYDEDGNFWFFAVHGDAEMTGDQQYLLDNISVTLAETDAVTFSVDYVLDFNVALSGEVTVSDPPPVVTSNSRVLLVNQIDPIENGIWVTSSGSWARASDMDTGDQIDYFVAGGYSVLDPSGIVGTDAMDWTIGINQRAIGDVLTDDFCLTEDYDQYEGTGVKVPYFRLYPVTPTASQVYGDRPAAFAAAFPDLPTDFYLAGVAYTIVRCKAIPLEHYSKAYRWRGLFSLGEPSIAVVSSFNRMYDPRDVTHDIDDSTTWTATDGNPVIIWAWWRTTKYGRNKPMASINWDKVAEEADKCDETVLDRSAVSIPRYRGGFAFPDNKPRHECEREILDTFDGFVVYDDEGKAWPRVGVYEAPTLTFSAARDILSEQTQTVDDGEAQVDGVIVEYTSPDHGYTKQPAAPWKNPNFYSDSITPNYRTIPILGCQNHNQAVRLAKAYGMLFGPANKAALGTTIKGILAKGERTIDLDLDAEFQGDYQIATPVIEGANGRDASFVVVPMQTDRYDLNEGEEGVPPAIPESLDIDNTLEVAVDVILSAVGITTDTGIAVRIEATFDAPTRVDRSFRFRYVPSTGGIPELFTTDMENLIAYSAIVSDGYFYEVSWQTVTAGGRATEWSTPVEIQAVANPTPPGDLVAAGATDAVGAAVVDWTTANDANQYAVAIYRGASFAGATLIETKISPANTSDSITETIAAGSYTYWAVPLNGSGIAGTEYGPLSVTVT